MQKVFSDVANEKPSKALSGLPWTPLGQLTLRPICWWGGRAFLKNLTHFGPSGLRRWPFGLC